MTHDRRVSTLPHGLALTLLTLTLGACGQLPSERASDAGTTLQPLALTTSDWTSGTLSSSTSIVPVSQLKPLPGGPGGNAIWKSNNPEIFRGSGWLMQNARQDAVRGGSASPLSGNGSLYFLHINKTGGTRYVHLLVSNPQSGSVTVSGKGSAYTNAEKPLAATPNTGGTGQSYWVARDWSTGSPRTTFSNVSIPSKGVYQVYRATMNDSNMLDGRFEINASAGVNVYTVVTSSGSTTDAINASQGGPASGDIYSESSTTFGREAGVYQNSVWTGSTGIDVPPANAYLGFALNTASKLSPGVQDQTSPALMRLSDSASRTYGNYGHRYDLTLTLNNRSTSARTVRLSFASNLVKSEDVNPGTTYNGPVLLNGTLKDVYTRPTAPKQWLATWTIQPGAYFNARLSFYIPGLITAGQQLILESIP